MRNNYPKRLLGKTLHKLFPFVYPPHSRQCLALRPVYTREPINPRSLPLWKKMDGSALIGESVCWSKIQRVLVGPTLRGRGERDNFFQPVENGRG